MAVLATSTGSVIAIVIARVVLAVLGAWRLNHDRRR
jgi:hypothetical protein